MSKATKMYILIVSIALIFSLGTGTNIERTRKPKEKEYFKWLASISSSFDIRLKDISGAESTEVIANSEPMDDLEEKIAVSGKEIQPVVKGIYLTSWVTSNLVAFNRQIDFINKTEVNSVVIDVKDDFGTISYQSNVPLVKTVGSSLKKYNPAKILEVLKENHIYPIARIVVFKDPFLAKHRQELAVRSAEGGLWHDYKGLFWVDPYNKEVWDYNIDIAKEAIQYGFKEIQFDYIRFTSDGIVKNCRYPKSDGRSKSDVIRDFLKYAYQELSPLGARVSADVFGLTCSANGDIGIGQVIEKVAEGVDIICPMVYPSHYVKGSYKIPNPDLKPYETVYKSLTDAQQKLGNLDKKVVLRPWLQDFSLKSYYGREQLLAQIKAVENAGLQEWIFWNPGNKYDYRKYRLKSEVPLEMPTVPDNSLQNSELQYPNSLLDQQPVSE